MLFQNDNFDIDSLPSLLAFSTGCGAALLIVSLLFKVVYNLFFHPLHSFPGPWIRAASDLPYALSVVRGDSVFFVKDLHDRYGPVVRTGPNRLSFNNAAAFNDIYGHRQGKLNMAKDPSMYSSGKELEKGRSLIASDDENHSRQRRVVAHAFSARALEEQQNIVQSYVDLMMRQMRKHSGDEKVDMVAWYNWATFDIIGDLAFGESFGALQNASYHPWIVNIFTSMKVLALMHATQSIPALSKLLIKCVPESLRKKREQHFEFAREKADRRMATTTDRKDFMSYILRHNDEKGMNKHEINLNSATFVLAGSETTATLLSGVTYYLLLNPAMMKKAKDEVRSSFKSEDEIDFRSVSRLTYLIACLSEALRMYPPVPTGLSRLVPKGGDEIIGHYVPEGTQVSVSHWAMHRSERNFQNADSFIPDRWLGDERYAKDDLNAVQPFSTGPRNCIGKNLAYVEMRLIFARVLWNFDLELCRESRDWARQKVFTLWEKPGLFVKITARKME